MSEQQQNPIWYTISILLIGLVVGYVLGATFHNPGSGVANVPSVPSVPTVPDEPSGTAPQVGVGPTEGKSSATVTLVEFTDFQCPFCSRNFAQTYPQIKTNYVDTGKIKYELRNFPLTSIHPNAQISAETAMCAYKLGGNDKFWQMHDALFSSPNHDTWSTQTEPTLTATLTGYATGIGLNEAAFTSCLTKHDTASLVSRDVADATAAGVTGTPGFWVVSSKGNQFISGAVPYATFQAAIDKLL